jgi:hypothetical protein
MMNEYTETVYGHGAFIEAGNRLLNMAAFLDEVDQVFGSQRLFVHPVRDECGADRRQDRCPRIRAEPRS